VCVCVCVCVCKLSSECILSGSDQIIKIVSSIINYISSKINATLFD